MTYWLGIDVGSTFTTAAIYRERTGQQAQLEVIPLSTRSVAVRSVVYQGPDGEVIIGEAAERRTATDPDRVASEFTQHALLVRWVIDLVVQREGAAAQGITLTHPASWNPGNIQSVADALSAAGLPVVRFCSGSQAAAAGYSIRERSALDSTIAVYDLGGGTFEAAVIRKTDAVSFATLGIPERIERLGGTDFDDAVFGHVLTAVPALRELASGTAETARLKRSLALCRRDCTEAKETLSAETEVTIPVLLPQVQAQVCLTRAEFEDLIRPQVERTVEALRRTLRSAGVGPAGLDTVLLVGGSSRVPLVAELLSAELGRPVAVSPDPQVAIALGAAVFGLPAGTAHTAGFATMDVESDTPIPEPAGITNLAGPGRSEPTHTQLPPWLTAAPPEVEPAEVQGQQRDSRRLPRFAVAGLIGLVLLGGVVSVPFIMTAHHGSVPVAPAVPAPRAPALQAPVLPAPAPRPPVAEAPVDQNAVVPAPVVPDPQAPAPAAPAPNTASGADPGLTTPAAPAKPPSSSKAATVPAPNSGSRSASRPRPPAATPAPPPPRDVPDWVKTARS